MDPRKPTELRRIQHVWTRDEDPAPRTPVPRWLSIAMGVGLLLLIAIPLLSRLVH